jgi:hypothetical protein
LTKDLDTGAELVCSPSSVFSKISLLLLYNKKKPPQ